MRFDGRMGFPGGFIDKGPCEDIVDGLNRELVEEIALDIERFPFNQSHHVLTSIYSSRKLCLHFYAQEVSIEHFKEIEAAQTNAMEWGMEVNIYRSIALFYIIQFVRPNTGLLTLLIISA